MELKQYSGSKDPRAESLYIERNKLTAEFNKIRKEGAIRGGRGDKMNVLKPRPPGPVQGKYWAHKITDVAASHVEQLKLQEAAQTGLVNEHIQLATDKLLAPHRQRQSVWDDEAEALHQEQRDYLNKVDRGRSVRKLDPNAPEFSQQAEDERQLKALGIKPNFGPANPYPKATKSETPDLPPVQERSFIDKAFDYLFAPSVNRQKAWTK